MNLVEKIKGTVHKWRYNNVFVNNYYASKRKELLTKKFISSKAYDELMTSYANADFTSFVDDAEQRTKNFMFRHMKHHKILGGWRWKGLWQYREQLIPIIFNENIKGIDFGGANGPISLTIPIVDFAKKDSFNRVVKYNSLTELDFLVDFIFSSHTLEHIEDLDLIFSQMNEKLNDEGQLIFLVPAYSCKRWNSGVHINKKFNDHAWTFYLSKNKPDHNFKKLNAFDLSVGRHFDVKVAEYVGDNSIYVLAKKRK
ncbi:methyltransferase domain-containing protein [Acidiluteibacter ferrifornacis]|uniref:Methyltransferase domain-containing protein n=1 Tax=Acidiluteibacter ferrifornacis TaxID=2692424 RepID=A0A6N9NKX4_9FLAO|nr:methyltransferase domain-containing protein [Acidiluteibacter ferrifornacis]NBG65880.1 methyltransferase domain-containing protein [Acidiluteibacter ferrifornacis]